jgi:hypothetical protein
MDSYVLAKPASSASAGVITASTDIVLTTVETGAQILYTVDGTDPRSSGGAVAAGAQTYSAPFHVTASGLLTARVRKAGVTGKHTEWSAPLRSYYIIGAAHAAPGDVTVSELMYHPADPTPAEITAGFTNSDDFEFIELMNTGSQRVNLFNCRFTAGFDFTFDGALNPALLELNPGERIVLVKNAAAFALRYGAAASARIAGQFSGNDQLNNAGEALTLVSGTGSPLCSFTYSDALPWPAADGNGASLVLIAPRTHPDLNNAANWRASVATGGNPATDDALHFTGNPSADSDQDGWNDLIEYALGSAPAIVPAITAQGLTITIPRVANADDAIIAGEVSASLSTWLPADLISSTPASLTFRVPDALSSEARLFLRASVRLR